MIETFINYGVYSQEWYLFTKHRFDRGDIYLDIEKWETEVDRNNIKLPSGFTPIHWQIDAAGKAVKIISYNDQFLSFLDIDGSKVILYLSSKDNKGKDKVIESFRTNLPTLDDSNDGMMSVKFWYNTPQGPQVFTRLLSSPQWEDIKSNYVPETRQHLEKLMNGFQPDELEGHLLLFYGVPGCGKSYLLRALSESWKSWASVDYIVDPEEFFGSASYLMDILSSQHEGESIDYDDDGHPIIKSISNKWKLLILEDAGDFITVDAKHKMGQSLGRLLNVADGFIGQGLKILILITTNEDFENLHSAVSREGRSVAIVPFKPFSRQEAKEWMLDHNPNWVPEDQEYTLADLYAQLRKKKSVRAKKEAKRTVGFTRI